MLVRQDNGRRVHPWRDYCGRSRCARTPSAARADFDRAGGPHRGAAIDAGRAAEGSPARRRDQPGMASAGRADRRGAGAGPGGVLPAVGRSRCAGAAAGGTTGPPCWVRGGGPGDVNAEGQPVWFGGRKLAPDLSLPALRARWRSAEPAPDPIPPGPHEYAMVGRAERAAALQQATAAARDAAGALRAEPLAGSAVAHATADLLAALCAVTRRSTNPVPRAVSDEFDRAARTRSFFSFANPARWPPVAGELRRAAWRLAAARSVTRGRDDDPGMAELMVAVAARSPRSPPTTSSVGTSPRPRRPDARAGLCRGRQVAAGPTGGPGRGRHRRVAVPAVRRPRLRPPPR